jgi:hypothetical protein
MHVGNAARARLNVGSSMFGKISERAPGEASGETARLSGQSRSLLYGLTLTC